jgi:hypothetical protein
MSFRIIKDEEIDTLVLLSNAQRDKRELKGECTNHSLPLWDLKDGDTLEITYVNPYFGKMRIRPKGSEVEPQEVSIHSKCINDIRLG